MHIQRRRHVNPAIQSSSDSRIQSAMERGGSDPSAIGVVFPVDGQDQCNETVALVRGGDLSSARLLRPLDQISSSEEKVSPNLGLGLGNRDGTV
jgi:hypothetical protein